LAVFKNFQQNFGLFLASDILDSLNESNSKREKVNIVVIMMSYIKAREDQLTI